MIRRTQDRSVSFRFSGECASPRDFTADRWNRPRLPQPIRRSCGNSAAAGCGAAVHAAVAGIRPGDVAAARAAAIARLSQRLVECISGAGGRPRHAGVGDQCEAGRLAGLVAEVAANVALMGEEQVAAQRVQALALGELAAYWLPEFFAADAAADVDGAHEPAVLVRRPGQGCSAGCWRAAWR
jgi:hypothetical protein